MTNSPEVCPVGLNHRLMGLTRMTRIGADKLRARWRRHNEEGWEWMNDHPTMENTTENHMYQTAVDWVREDLTPNEHAALEALGFREAQEKVEYGISLLRSQTSPHSWLFE